MQSVKSNYLIQKKVEILNFNLIHKSLIIKGATCET